MSAMASRGIYRIYRIEDTPATVVAIIAVVVVVVVATAAAAAAAAIVFIDIRISQHEGPLDAVHGEIQATLVY